MTKDTIDNLGYRTIRPCIIIIILVLDPIKTNSVTCCTVNNKNEKGEPNKIRFNLQIINLEK